MIIESRAYARAGLLGNPSDGYFGKTISFVVRNFGAHISLYESPELKIEQIEDDKNEYRNIYHLIESVKQKGYYGGERLVKAAIKKFSEYCEERELKLHGDNFTIRYRSSIPRQVGLAGSSAIITATMRALVRFYGIEIPKEILPNLVLAAEKDELGINAGLQDRVIQAFEGCVHMDFDKEFFEENGFGRYTAIDPSILPNFYIAYDTDLSKVSGAMFNDIRARYHQGDTEVIDVLNEIAALADMGKAALESGDHKLLHSLINKNFDLRASIMDVGEKNRLLIEKARACGASAKFPGSGGAIIGTYKNDEVLRKLIIEMNKINVRVIKPFIV
jgi:glucuronokinase